MPQQVKPRTIYIDCSVTYLQGGNTGIPRVVRNIVARTDFIRKTFGIRCVPVVFAFNRIWVINNLNSKIIDFNPDRITSLYRKLFSSFKSQVKRWVPIKPLRKCFLLFKSQIKRVVPGRFLEILKTIFGGFCYGIRRLQRYVQIFFSIIFLKLYGRVIPLKGDLFLAVDIFWSHNVIDYLEVVSRRGIPVIALIYDLIPMNNPKYVINDLSMKFSVALERLLPISSGVIGISRIVNDEITNFLDKKDNPKYKKIPVDYFYLGANLQIKKKAGTEVVRKWQDGLWENGKVYLMVGTIEIRKGYDFVLNAFERMWRNGSKAKLLIIGQLNWDMKTQVMKLKDSAYYGSLFFVFHDINDTELIHCYRNASALIQASHVEGFGLPLVEAMENGIPVVASDIPVFKEIGGDYPVYFSLDSMDSFVDALRLVLDKEFKCKNWISWDESVSSLMEKALSIYARKIDLIPFSKAPLQTSQHRQLLVDVSELVQRDAKSGIQRVVRSILQEWLTHPPKNMRVEPVYATLDHGYRYARCFTLSSLNYRDIGLEDDPIEFRAGDIFLGLDFQSHVTLTQKDFFQKLRRHGVKVFFVIYDLLPILLPKTYPGGSDLVHQRWLSEVIIKSDGAICISKTVAQELSAWIEKHGTKKPDPFEITWFHLGSDIKNSAPTRGMPDDAGRVMKKIQEQPSFLMTGTLEPRKGHAQILAAFEQLWMGNVRANLVIVGKQGWLTEALIERLRQHPELNERLFWLENISDEYLEKIYTASTCLIAASQGEGFGLPLIEAARHKLPIIARDIPVFREIAGEHAYYFTGTEPKAFAQAVQDWLGLFKLEQHPKSDNMPWLTWEQSAAQLLDAVESIAIPKKVDIPTEGEAFVCLTT